MKKILLIGKLNETVKDLNMFLARLFHVQICSEDPNVFLGMLKVVKPDLILISLIGAYDIDPSIFSQIRVHCADTPVLTIGTESERQEFLQFYEGEQFENLIRPVENSAVYEAICRRLSIPMQDLTLLASGNQEGKKQILIVDDNAQTLRGIKAMLDDNYDISVATSGMKAMTSLGKNRPDLILLDYEMPVCDGKQTLEMIRADEELSDIPVIFLTGVSDREHIQAVLGLKPSGYLLKPPVKDTLIDAIEKALSA